MVLIQFVFFFIASNADFFCIYYNNVITGINVRRIFWFVFTAKTTRNLRSKTTQRLPFRINYVPIALNFCWLCTKCFHRYLVFLLKAQ